MKKNTTLFILVIAAQFSVAQQVSFDSEGKKIKYVSEKIEVTVEKPAEKKDASPVLASALGSIVKLGVGAVQAHLNAKQESYTATYNGRATGKPFLRDNANLDMNKVTVKRLIVREGGGNAEEAALITLGVEQDGSVFRFKTEKIKIDLAKARIKKSGNRGKTVDLNIDIKVDAIWMEYDKDKESSKLESATVGNSSITINTVKPGTTVTDANYSDWFKMIPPAHKNVTSQLKERGWYTITITIKEANPYGVNSKKMAEFFKENSETITTLIQGFLPKADEEEKEKEEEPPTEPDGN